MKRLSKTERIEQGCDGCNIWGQIASAAVGGLLGGINNEGGTKERSEETISMPVWPDETYAYLFGDEATLPDTPKFTAEALNYARGLSGGYNPAYGAQEPMGFDDFLAGVSGLSTSRGNANPYYLDPSAQRQSGGVRGLLGYDRNNSPPMFTNSPYYGVDVANPGGLQANMSIAGEGGYSGEGWGSNQAGAEQAGTGPGTGAAKGKVVANAGGGPGFSVDVDGQLLDMKQAYTLMQAGLLEIEGYSNLSPGRAMAINASTDDPMGG